MEADVRALALRSLKRRYGDALLSKSEKWKEDHIEEFEKGFRMGVTLCQLQLILKKIQKGKAYDKIKEEAEIDDDSYFKELWDLIQDYPNDSAEELVDIYFEY